MRKHVAVIALFSVLALALTQPLALYFATHVVGDGSDDPALTWNLWWFKHALLDLQVSPLTSDAMFYPIGVNLVFYTLTLLNDALSLPLQAIFGLLPAANLLLLSSFVLSGYGAFLLAQYTLRRSLPGAQAGIVAISAVGAGVVFAFSSNKSLYASLGQYNIASSQWIPFYILYVFRLRDALEATAVSTWYRVPRAAVREAALAALFLLLQAYAEFTFASFLVVFTALFALIHWKRPRLIVALALVGALIAVCFLPILVPMLQELRTEGDIFVEGSGFAEAFSADLLGFIVPSRLHPLLGGLDSLASFPYINFVFLGWVTLAVAAGGAWAYRRVPQARFWTVAAGVFALIALGPDLRINGTAYALPLPFRLFQFLPIFNGNRYPSRYSVMVTLGIAMLVAFGLVWLGERVVRRKADATATLPRLVMPVVAIGLMLGEHWAVLPLSDYHVPEFYSEIRADAGDFTVLELPLDWRNGFRVTGTLDKVFMLSQFYQTVHEKPMLSGNTSRNPELKFQYFTEAPVINSLIALETGHAIDDATLASDRRLAPAVLGFFNIRYIVVRPEAGSRVQPYLDAVLPGLTLWREDRGVRVYTLTLDTVNGPLAFGPLNPIARLYVAEGWGELGAQRLWAQREETRLLLPAAPRGGELRLTLASPERQTISLELNGHRVATKALSAGSAPYALTVPPGVTDGAVNDLRIHWSASWPVNQLPHPSTARFIVAKSAGNEVGDFAHIWIDGVEVSPNIRGYNVWLDGRAAAFDTFASASEADSFAGFISDERASVALAVRDEASRYLKGAILDQFRRHGARTDIGWRWSHAFVKTHDAYGNAVTSEDASPIRPAIASYGERISAPVVYGALERLELVPAAQ